MKVSPMSTALTAVALMSIQACTTPTIECDCECRTERTARWSPAEHRDPDRRNDDAPVVRRIRARDHGDAKEYVIRTEKGEPTELRIIVESKTESRKSAAPDVRTVRVTPRKVSRVSKPKVVKKDKIVRSRNSTPVVAVGPKGPVARVVKADSRRTSSRSRSSTGTSSRTSRDAARRTSRETARRAAAKKREAERRESRRREAAKRKAAAAKRKAESARRDAERKAATAKRNARRRADAARRDAERKAAAARRDAERRSASARRKAATARRNAEASRVAEARKQAARRQSANRRRPRAMPAQAVTRKRTSVSTRSARNAKSSLESRIERLEREVKGLWDMLRQLQRMLSKKHDKSLT